MAYINYDLATHLRGNNFDQQLPFISASKPLLRISSPPRSDILDYKIVRRPKFVPVSKPLPRIPSPPRCLKYVRVRNSIPSFRSTINKPLVGTLSSRCSIKTPKVSKKTDEEIAHTTSTVNKTTAEEFVGVEETPIIKVTRTEIGYCKYRDTCQNKEEPSSPENNQVLYKTYKIKKIFQTCKVRIFKFEIANSV